MTLRRTLALALLLSVSSAFAQEYDEQVSVSYVMVPFTVLSAKGVPITDLAEKEVTQANADLSTALRRLDEARASLASDEAVSKAAERLREL